MEPLVVNSYLYSKVIGIMINNKFENRYDLLVLDFDGTIGDTNKIIITTMKMVFRKLSLPDVSDEECQRTIGLPLEKCFQAVLPQLTDAEADHCAAVYRQIFEENKATIHVQPFPHVLETMATLHERNVQMTIASSRYHESLMQFVNDMGIDKYIRLILGADDVKRAKPCPDPVLQTLKAMNISAERTLVVGDAPYDILMGRNAGCDTCGVSYGNSTEEELRKAGAKFIISDFAQLLEL